MLTIELLIRAAGVTLLLMQAGLLWRDARSLRTAQFGIALTITLCAVMATDSAGGMRLPHEWLLVLTPFSMSSAIVLWWFSQSLFDDEFRITPFQLVIAALWVGLGLFNYLDVVHLRSPSFTWPSIGRSLMAVGFVGHIVYLAIGERKNDLVERRRRVRTYFALTIMAVFFMDLITEYFFGMENVPLWSSALQHGIYLTIIVWAFFWLGRIDVNELLFDHPAAPVVQPESALSTKETILKEKLDAIMDSEQAWLEPTLSITTLAERIGAPEHQLRQLINKTMGQRNFRSFLNHYRLTAAKRALADKALAATPILTIAMDSGFASLSSFNRAFKMETGSTPSEYREAALNGQSTQQNAPQN